MARNPSAARGFIAQERRNGRRAGALSAQLRRDVPQPAAAMLRRCAVAKPPKQTPWVLDQAAAAAVALHCCGQGRVQAGGRCHIGWRAARTASPECVLLLVVGLALPGAAGTAPQQATAS